MGARPRHGERPNDQRVCGFAVGGARHGYIAGWCGCGLARGDGRRRLRFGEDGEDTLRGGAGGDYLAGGRGGDQVRGNRDQALLGGSGDGDGAGAAVLFARLAPGTQLSAASFTIVQPVSDLPAK